VGILAPYEPSTTADIPAAYRDPAGLWTAFALRGRVLAYDPTRLAADQLPTAWHHVTDPRFKGRFAMADPRFGTTRGHMAALLDLWGKDAVRGFYESLRANEFIRADGNAHAVRLLALGRADLVATDTDDVLVAQKNGQSIAMIFPDHDAPDDGRKTPGTLWIPNSVALVRGAPHPEAARKLIDFIASEEIERRLFAGESRNVPVRPRLREELGATLPAEATIDYAAAAARLAASDDLVTEVLLK
jgi:iron(III) transport system substrate-binding protein